MDPMVPAGGGNILAALLFMTSAMMTLDAYSTFESSPWTAENFGADPIKAASCREYLTHAVVYSMAYAAASAFIAKSWWPVLGAAISNAYLVWLYLRALDRGKTTGSSGWVKGT
ncbi:MAG: hypothetical protein ACRD1G_14745 [Acidimicrobiales bacterium]